MSDETYKVGDDGSVYMLVTDHYKDKQYWQKVGSVIDE